MGCGAILTWLCIPMVQNRQHQSLPLEELAKGRMRLHGADSAAHQDVEARRFSFPRRSNRGDAGMPMTDRNVAVPRRAYQ